MSKLYRLEVETLCINTEANISKRSEMVYDFVENDLVTDERTWSDGQDFYDPQHSPHIYADKKKADAVYDELSAAMEEWEPFEGSLDEGTNEYLEAYRLVSIDENGDEKVEAENKPLEMLIEVNRLLKETAVAD